MNRRPLGRGLDALIQSTTAFADARRAVGDESLTAGAANDKSTNGSPEGSSNGADTGRVDHAALQLIALERIVPGRFQPRQYFAEAALAELAEAIKAQGIIEPLIARRTADGYELIAGERRLRAARIAGLAVVPVIVRDLDDRAALEMSLVENLLREDLNVVEEGQAFARLSHEFALTHDAIATRIGKSRSYVTNIIRLMELPEEVLQMIGRGELTGGQVRPLLALSSPEAQLAEARKIAETKISSRDAEAIASAQRGSRRGQGARAVRVDDPNLIALAESLQRALKRKVRIVRRRGKSPGRVELEFYNDDDLTGLARTLAASGRATAQSSHL
jgi:ParB family chromosome partitioning protein